MINTAVHRTVIKKINAASVVEMEDLLAAEEPMELRLLMGPPDDRTQKSLSVTMRTPGNDAELAMGFLFTEGIIQSADDVVDIRHISDDENIIVATLSEGVTPDTQQMERHFYTTSSCGVCGKSSIDAVKVVRNKLFQSHHFTVPAATLYSLPDQLAQIQEVFESTGGLHASALFDLSGNNLIVREDVGRHNALDKVIGAMLNEARVPLQDHILLLSGRASFELIQKAAMAGIRLVAAVGAPSSLAVQLAKDQEITLVGFLRGERFNIYSGEQRIVF
ncbi:formate dehydrogenase accessory sulfurtransferase FdhD [Taibaiella soli]|uniref:Sulfur carrier protein FdhD n=1 Tax=Taibaiella soli TaxID=1649169 RepID=A0A2W2A7A6_9BACT|nr:formate dehydrogenase accessory sulfurtransferase FdhD [Taibaiella soli]PZF71111.1 formate dehydrogenase accessory sulfurtransferase FdhD [Taibaiella soli]